MRKKLPCLWLLSLVLLLVAGCRHEPEPQSLTVTEPNEVDLVGVYEIDTILLPAGLADLKLDTQLELKSDGTFSARNIPPALLAESLPTATFLHTLISCTGVWSKRKYGALDPGHQPIWGIHLADKAYTAANINGPRKEWLSVRCTGQAPPYGILFQLGDPKQGYEIRLKIANPKNPTFAPKPSNPGFIEPGYRSSRKIEL